ncbi:MAG TPA: RHS repeat domain-containing protein [Terriglobales bacterium]|nr:RHS repeat domain-containing protein [Terriglobales bacterium]
MFRCPVCRQGGPECIRGRQPQRQPRRGEEPTSLTDANGAQTSWQYGTTVGYGLPTKITHPDSSVTNIAYTVWAGPGAAASTESVTNFSSASDDEYTLFDSLGRTVLQQKWNGTKWDSVATIYDADGRPWKVSAPFATSKGSSGGSAFTITSYDGSSRPLGVDGPTGGWTKYTYTDNDVLAAHGPAPAGGGGASQERQMEYDALGRLSSVCEQTAGTSAWPSGTCGQTAPTSGYWTEYAYNLLDKMTSVTQNAQAAGSHQTRSFAFDELGRLTQETTPEAGTTSFWFDTPDGSQCTASSPGDLVEREDNAGNYTCYGYDERHRLTLVTYPSGPNAAATPTRHFTYDATADGSINLTNTLGRLAEAYTQTTGGVQVDEAFSYTPSGQVSDAWQESPHSGGYYHSGETHELVEKTGCFSETRGEAGDLIRHARRRPTAGSGTIHLRID